MIKYYKILLPLCFVVNALHAQQIIRQTLSSTGSIKTATPFRVSYTFGSCPGCGTLHPNSPANAGYLRQGFQQPPAINDNLACANQNLSSSFAVIQEPSTLCGSKFDLEYAGTSLQGVNISWDFGAGAIPGTSILTNPVGVYYATPGQKEIILTVQKAGCTKSSSHFVNINANQIGFAASSAGEGMEH